MFIDCLVDVLLNNLCIRVYFGCGYVLNSHIAWCLMAREYVPLMELLASAEAIICRLLETLMPLPLICPLNPAGSRREKKEWKGGIQGKRKTKK